MIVLVVNCGSSSMKYQLIDMSDEHVMVSGVAERITFDHGVITHKLNGEKIVIEKDMATHKDAVDLLMEFLVDPKYHIINSMSDIDAVGHRVLHGGSKYSESVVVDDAVLKAIEECIPLGPLHNPANLMGINACAAALPGVPQVAVFDTAFHQTMPAYASTYPIPYEYVEKHKIRKYGFHGTSHRYVSLKAAEMMGTKEFKLVTCHLGNGASCAAVLNGKCVDTSMGLTPLDGLEMGTRCGTIDPAVVKFLCDKEGLTVDQVDDILNKKSGVLGVSGVSNDFRDVEEAMNNGNERARLAMDIFYYRVRTTIGQYAAAMDGVDAIVFTAGVGENSASARTAICKGLTYLGVKIDEELNSKRGEAMFINTPDSKVKVMVIPTNEELMIALDTVALTKDL
ncbi:MAG: acetate kinase [Eubacteriaceae bacterium]|nr:acetate kinase [Eubacteriaceae bacterium]MBQ1466279.1 acetate kinase [Eubacteriaceae bacterium]MBR2781223.1 acetate kinase [Eubacteriaceae bacterium]